MRKTIVSLVLCLVLVAGLVYGANIPAPFGRAKQIACLETPNEHGNYVRVYKFEMDGQQITCGIAYYVKQQLIMIACESQATFYKEDTGELIAGIFSPGGLQRAEATDEQILGFAFNVFRELVKHGLIGNEV